VSFAEAEETGSRNPGQTRASHEGADMADTDVKYQVYVKVAVEGQNDFQLAFDFSGDPRQHVTVHCSRDLSKADAKWLEGLATNFIGNMGPVIFKAP
jgi:hypothetical protein